MILCGEICNFVNVTLILLNMTNIANAQNPFFEKYTTPYGTVHFLCRDAACLRISAKIIKKSRPLCGGRLPYTDLYFDYLPAITRAISQTLFE